MKRLEVFLDRGLAQNVHAADLTMLLSRIEPLLDGDIRSLGLECDLAPSRSLTGPVEVGVSVLTDVTLVYASCSMERRDSLVSGVHDLSVTAYHLPTSDEVDALSPNLHLVSMVKGSVYRVTQNRP